MARREGGQAFATKFEADQHQRNLKGTPGYSEVYGRGVRPCKYKDPKTGEIHDGWGSYYEEYRG